MAVPPDTNGSHFLPKHTDVAIVGAGFAGLGMAVRLRQAGRHDFVVLEKASEVGGTWEANTYPGCQCDVPSHLYSFSFAPNPGWTQTFALQPEIWAYLRQVSDEFGLRPHIRFGCELSEAAWDDGTGLWKIETSRGPMTARVLVAAMGALSRPSIPSIPGASDFEGAAFHTARWDGGRDLRGKRVAVIGTGASAIQVIPKIQPEVASLTVFQRTPPWILPHPGRPVSARERRLFKALPAAQKAVRGAIYWSRELLVLGFKRHRLSLAPRLIALRHLKDQVADPELRRRLTPDYEIGCKRILLSDEYFPALQQPNVELVDEGVTEVRPHSVVDAGGREHEVDTIVWGTGFKATEMEAGEHIRGRGGRLLGDTWRGEGMQAHRGTTIAGFPNLFLMFGPNTTLGHNSMVFILESQIAYAIDALQAMDERGASIVDTRPEAQAAFNGSVQKRMKGTVWVAGGCASWYLDDRGNNPVIWPGTSWSYRQATRRFDLAEHVLG